MIEMLDEFIRRVCAKHGTYILEYTNHAYPIWRVNTRQELQAFIGLEVLTGVVYITVRLGKHQNVLHGSYKSLKLGNHDKFNINDPVFNDAFEASLGELLGGKLTQKSL